MQHPDAEQLRGWVGRSEVRREPVDQDAAFRLAGLLDVSQGVWPPDEVPPLGHWLQFLPNEPQAALSPDGHPDATALLPARPRERRMWAGGRVVFHRPLAFGAMLERRSEVADIGVKQGASGELVFVTLRHTIAADGVLALVEEQDLVYRDPPKDPAPQTGSPPDPPQQADWREPFSPDPVRLFRYSALTYNAHRIHYDREFTRQVEGYPALVVHGPLIATLMMTSFMRRSPGARPAQFSFRARHPLFDTGTFDLCGAAEPDATRLWAVDGGGRTCMQAEVRGEAT